MGRQRVVHRDKQRKKRKQRRERQTRNNLDNTNEHEYEYDEYVTIIGHCPEEQPLPRPSTSVTKCQRTNDQVVSLALPCDAKDGGEGPKEDEKKEKDKGKETTQRTTNTTHTTIPSLPRKDDVVPLPPPPGSHKVNVSNDADTARIERMRAKKRQRKEARRMKQQR